MGRKPRRRSWGSVTERARGKRYLLRWVENTPAGRKRVSKTFHGTYSQACAELARIQTEHAEDRPCPTVGYAYRTWYLPWLERKRESGGVSKSTFSAYERAWRLVIAPRWEKTPLDSIRPLDVQQWLLEQNRGNAKVAVVVMRKILDFAMQYEVVESNRMRLDYEMPTKATRSKRNTTYGMAKARAILARLRDTPAEAPFLLACFGGARVGESLGVKACEVYRVEAHGAIGAAVPIVRQMEQTDGMSADGALKNPQSVRVTVVPGEEGARVLEIAKRRSDEGSEWLADRGDGMPMTQGQLFYWYRHVLGDDAIPFSNLRASWRTFAQYEWGCDYDTLEALMGHAIPGVTGAHYLKPSDEQIIDSFLAVYASYLGTFGNRKDVSPAQVALE